MHILNFVAQELLECSLIRQLEHIGGDEELVVHASKSILHHFLALASAEQDAKGRIIAFMHLIFFVI